ncbi:MAG: cytochrome c biogenesis CcdA family protein [Armatimonadota bacterium]
MSVTDTIGIPAAFLAGILSFMSPCVLPLVPAYLSYMSGSSIEEMSSAQSSNAIRRTGARSAMFVLGFTTVFVAMGATASFIGQALSAQMDLLMKIAGVVIIIFGLHIAGVFRIKALYSEKRFHIKMKNVGLPGAFIIGIMFALGWTPCIGPVLSGILTLAGNSETLSRGMILLSFYSLGLGVPFLMAGFATGRVLDGFAKFKKHFRKIEIVSGILMVIVGVTIFTGSLQMFSGFASQWFG